MSAEKQKQKKNKKTRPDRKTQPTDNTVNINSIQALCESENRHYETITKNCPIIINGIKCFALFDSGNSAGNAMSWQCVQKIGLSEKDIR